MMLLVMRGSLRAAVVSLLPLSTPCDAMTYGEHQYDHHKRDEGVRRRAQDGGTPRRGRGWPCSLPILRIMRAARRIEHKPPRPTPARTITYPDQHVKLRKLHHCVGRMLAAAPRPLLAVNPLPSGRRPILILILVVEHTLSPHHRTGYTSITSKVRTLNRREERQGSRNSFTLEMQRP